MDLSNLLQQLVTHFETWVSLENQVLTLSKDYYDKSASGKSASSPDLSTLNSQVAAESSAIATLSNQIAVSSVALAKLIPSR